MSPQVPAGLGFTFFLSCSAGGAAIGIDDASWGLDESQEAALAGVAVWNARGHDIGRVAFVIALRWDGQ